ncbi:hypothetical protein L484_026204 [Morus notabilis]|uniref:Uncharacterized protein n=1 Tax=Morus notabilis TaxID=981085 RepID=W9REE4_9ROSA|nr:uncharacterized protein LOC21408869 [Morus notabilis]EXB74509.1 hypothetical protein L484_026204 [Morus notabilis]
MEAAEEQGRGLLHQILPPRLEDAGLEDCALPPDSIKEAFIKAATVVKSRAASILYSDEDEDADGDCVKDPWPDAKDRSDVVVGVSPEGEAPGPCATENGTGAAEIGGDDVAVGGGDELEDKVVVGSEDEKGGKDCVEGLQGLEIGDEKKKNGGGDEEDKGEEDEDRPILVGGYV